MRLGQKFFEICISKNVCMDGRSGFTKEKLRLNWLVRNQHNVGTMI